MLSYRKPSLSKKENKYELELDTQGLLADSAELHWAVISWRKRQGIICWSVGKSLIQSEY